MPIKEADIDWQQIILLHSMANYDEIEKLIGVYANSDPKLENHFGLNRFIEFHTLPSA